MSDPVVWLSVLSGALMIVNQTLIRKKMWIGWLLGVPNILLFMYTNWRAGSYGFTFLTGPFWLVNAWWAIQEWRTPIEITGKELWT